MKNCITLKQSWDVKKIITLIIQRLKGFSVKGYGCYYWNMINWVKIIG